MTVTQSQSELFTSRESSSYTAKSSVCNLEEKGSNPACKDLSEWVGYGFLMIGNPRETVADFISSNMRKIKCLKFK